MTPCHLILVAIFQLPRQTFGFFLIPSPSCPVGFNKLFAMFKGAQLCEIIAIYSCKFSMRNLKSPLNTKHSMCRRDVHLHLASWNLTNLYVVKKIKTKFGFSELFIHCFWFL